MAAKNSLDGFNFYCFLAGLGVGLIGGLYYLYYNVFILDRPEEMGRDFGTVVVFVLLGLAGAGVQCLSAGIESKNSSTATEHSVLFLAALLAFMLVPTGIVVLFYSYFDANAISAGSSLRPSFWELLWATIFGFLGMVMIIPAVICWIIVFPLALGLAAGGVFCLPRLLYYYSVRHPLLQAWEGGKQGGVISPQDISKGLGNPARNKVEAEKLKADLGRLERKIKEHQAQLEKDRATLRSAILEDAERFETEKRISAMLRNIDAVQTEVAGYREYMRKAGKQ